MSALYPTISHLSIDSFGLSETLYEPHEELLFYVFCDPINLSNPSQSFKISKLFEKCIRSYILLHRNEISEKLLKKAIEQAQNYFYKNYLSYENQLKVNVVIILQVPQPNEEMQERKILVAGVGDIKVYHLDESMQLIYYDPEIPQLPEGLSYKKRFNYITNAVGAPDLKCHITTSSLSSNSSLLISTYGSYHQTNKEKLYSIFSDFENKKNLIHKLIQKSKEKDHIKSFSFITFSKQILPIKMLENDSLDSVLEQEKILKKKDRMVPLWAVKIALVALVCLLCLEFFNYYLSITKTSSPFHFTKKVIPKEVHTNMSLKPLKKPLELPFLKERAYIVDLKEKYERQNDVIQKLQEIISEQDKALRNLQIRNYYKPETISAKSFRAKKGSHQNPDIENYSSDE